MTNLTEEDRQWLISRNKRLNNYCILKVGLFAIVSVYGLADFVNAGSILRFVYVLLWLLFVFYIYFSIDIKNYTKKIDQLIKSEKDE